MTDTDLQLIARHMRGALMGEPTPSVRGAGLGPLLAALGAPTAPGIPPAMAQAALARVGLVALALLLERATAGMHAERELALLRTDQRPA